MLSLPASSHQRSAFRWSCPLLSNLQLCLELACIVHTSLSTYMCTVPVSRWTSSQFPLLVTSAGRACVPGDPSLPGPFWLHQSVSFFRKAVTFGAAVPSTLPSVGRFDVYWINKRMQVIPEAFIRNTENKKFQGYLGHPQVWKSQCHLLFMWFWFHS